jgi:NADH-quinone oxidoreductase subunit J
LVRDFGSPQHVGLVLFQKYLLPFELTSILLLAAMVGAVLLARDDKKKLRPDIPAPTSKL